MKRKVKCAICSEVFEATNSFEEANKEADEWFPVGKRVSICDDCYQQVRPDRNPDAYANYLNWIESQKK